MNPDGYTLTKTAGAQSDVYIVGGENGSAIPSENLVWYVQLNRASGTSSAYGKDLIRSVDYRDVMTLPAGLNWAPKVLEAVKNGDMRRSGNDIYAGDVKIATISCNKLCRSTVMPSEDGTSLVFEWSVSNTSRTADLGSVSATFTICREALCADLETFTASAAGEEIRNTANATMHYTYGTDRTLTASAARTIKIQNGTLTLKKSANGGTYFGEDITYDVTLQNTGALPYTTDTSELSVRDTLSVYSYISPSNMEKMFNDTYGKNLTVIITQATLAQWQEVTAADGNSVSYRTSGNSDVGTDGQTLVVTKSENGYTVSVAGGGTYIGATVEKALKNAGYAVTKEAVYECRWVVGKSEERNLTIPGGQLYTYTVYAAAKDSFGVLPQDRQAQYPDSSSVAIANYARLYSKTAEGKDQQLKIASASTRAIREARLDKSVYDADGNYLGSTPTAASGDVLNYKLTFTHYGKSEYDDLPMVDDLCGSQYLMVPVEQNPSLDEKGLAKQEYQGTSYYILKEGSYQNVVVGMDDEEKWLTAATITVGRVDAVQKTVSGSYTGIHTQIKWYFAHLDGGSYRETISYQAVVDLSTSGASYTIGNIAWMNDRTDRRLYASIWGGGTMIVSDKEILETRGKTPKDDIVNEDDYSTIGEGEQVTYRLTLRNDDVFGAESQLYTRDFTDALPETYDIFKWVKDENITVEWETEGNVDVSGLENWSIISGDQSGVGLVKDRQCLAWADDTQITFRGAGTLYLYVTLTFPANTENGSDTWSRYTTANKGSQIDNTLYVYRFPFTVQHDLREGGKVALQKGVLALSRTNNYSRYAAGSDRQHYANADYYQRSVLYYVTLYNGGNKRLYLNDLQDQLPKGFRYNSLVTEIDLGKETWNFNNANSIITKGGLSCSNVGVTDLNSESNIVFRSAAVRAKPSEDKQNVTFSLSSGSGSYSLKYDEAQKQYYLDCGEAVAFVYEALVGDVDETGDSALNTIAMPYTDRLESGVTQLSKEIVPITAAVGGRFQDQNNGTRHVLTAESAKQAGFDVTGEEKWLVSSVTMQRGNIVPGITKYTDSYSNASGVTTKYTSSVSPFDTINWRIRVQNTGTTAMTNYTVTDVMPKPYAFTGTVHCTIYDSTNTVLQNFDLFAYQGKRTGTEDTVAIKNILGSNNLSLPLDGTSVSLSEKDHASSVSMNRDETGNETFAINFESNVFAIPEGGYMELTCSSANPTTFYVNSVYINRVQVTPNYQSFTDIGQGNTVCDESGRKIGVQNSSPATVSFGYATSSEKSLVETNHAENSACSTDMDKNTIILSDAKNTFRYTLTVNNDTDEAMSRLVLIDNLPQIGDHSPFDTAAGRSSEFDVNFADDPNVTVKITARDGTATQLDSRYYTVEYSTKTDFGGPQSDDWKGNDTGKWSRALNAGAHSIRLVITDEGRTQIPAKSKVEVSFSAVAGSNAQPGKVAWNSFGYHYALGKDIELESMPLVVGVKIPAVPTLKKQLVDDLDQPVMAETDESFRFLIYEGEALSGYDTEEALKAELDAKGRKYTETTVTVKAGATESEAAALLPDSFQWKEGEQYTAVEVTAVMDRYHLSGFAGGDETITFTYHAARDTALVCRNMLWQWGIHLNKVDSINDQKMLSGSVFALYSPDEKDKLDAIPAEYSELGIREKITAEAATWYLCGVQTTGEDGTISWENLRQEKYYLLEVKAPSGYNLPNEPGQVLSRDSAAQGVCTVTVQNARGVILPNTGGSGTLPFTISGTLLLTGSLISGYVLRRKRARKGI